LRTGDVTPRPKAQTAEPLAAWRNQESPLPIDAAEVMSGHPLAQTTGRREKMLYVLAVILLIAWLLGVVGTYTIGAFVHVLLVIAIVLFIVGLLSGRRTIV
jgi:hypothetical protein